MKLQQTGTLKGEWSCNGCCKIDADALIAQNAENNITSDPKTFGLTLILANQTWAISEPGNDSHFFKTNKGIYVYVPGTNTLFLCRENTIADCVRNKDSQVGNLTMTTDPSYAKKDDVGDGQALETGLIFTWKVV